MVAQSGHRNSETKTQNSETVPGCVKLLSKKIGSTICCSKMSRDAFLSEALYENAWKVRLKSSLQRRGSVLVYKMLIVTIAVNGVLAAAQRSGNICYTLVSYLHKVCTKPNTVWEIVRSVNTTRRYTAVFRKTTVNRHLLYRGIFHCYRYTAHPQFRSHWVALCRYPECAVFPVISGQFVRGVCKLAAGVSASEWL